jgi:pimeloyl-ACP methyl ester carboxylesterase
MKRRSLRALSKLGFHELSYLEWNADAGGVPVVCVHGLTRNALDFEALGEALAAAGRWVVSLDVVGRGQSGRLADPALYGYPQYLTDSAALLARLGAPEADWVGTSMGGLIGMMLAAQPGSPLRRIVINDVGPFVPKAALERIAEYLALERRFENKEHAEAHLKKVYAPFGIEKQEQWRRFTEISVEPDPEGGGLVPTYDQEIAAPFREAHLEDVDLWPVWDAMVGSVLVLRGRESDLLLRETAEEMVDRGPGCRLIEFAGCGHAPPLLEPAQIEPVVDFLKVS